MLVGCDLSLYIHIYMYIRRDIYMSTEDQNVGSFGHFGLWVSESAAGHGSVIASWLIPGRGIGELG